MGVDLKKPGELWKLRINLESCSKNRYARRSTTDDQCTFLNIYNVQLEVTGHNYKNMGGQVSIFCMQVRCADFDWFTLIFHCFNQVEISCKWVFRIYDALNGPWWNVRWDLLKSLL